MNNNKRIVNVVGAFKKKKDAKTIISLDETKKRVQKRKGDRTKTFSKVLNLKLAYSTYF